MLKIISLRSTIIQIPYSLTLETMYNLIDEVVDKNYDVKYRRIKFDFSRLNWIDAVGIAVLSNLIEFLKSGGARVKFAGYDLKVNAIRYLDDSGFFKQYLGGCIGKTATLRSTTIPLQLVSHKKSFSWIENELMPWMAERIGLKQSSLATIKV